MVIKLHLHDELYIHIQAKQAAKTTNEIINYYKKAVSVVLKPPALNWALTITYIKLHLNTLSIHIHK